MFKWKIWNVDRAQPVGGLMRSLRKANATATMLEMRSGEHHAVVAA